MRDVFICHASEDKEAIVKPLATLLKKQLGESRVWYDEFSISTGDGINKKIHEGLKETRVGVVIFSEVFFNKPRALMELGVLNFNSDEERNVLIPLCYEISPKEVKKKLSHFGDIRVRIVNKNNLNEVAEEIIAGIKKVKLKEGKERVKKRIKGIILYGFLAICLFIFSYLFYSPTMKPTSKTESNLQASSIFDTSKHSYNVLLFPFKPHGNCTYKSDIEEIIATRLSDMNELENLNLQVRFDSVHCVKKYSDAELFGKEQFADLVIWGDLFEKLFSDDKEASLKYINISRRYYVPGINRGESAENNISLAEVSKGKLQKNIDYIIYWVTASRAFSKEEYASALVNFQKIENSMSINDDLLNYMGLCYFYLDSIDKAKMYFKNAIKLNPKYGEAEYNYASLLMTKENDYQGANKILSTLLEKIDSSALILNGDSQAISKVHYIYAINLEHFNDIMDAKEHYEIALKFDSVNEAAEYKYAMLLDLEFNNINTANEHFIHLLRVNPNDYYTNATYAIFLNREFNDSIGSRKYYEISLSLNPNCAIFHYYYSCLLRDKFHDLTEADNHFREAFRLDPSIVYEKAPENYQIK